MTKSGKNSSGSSFDVQVVLRGQKWTLRFYRGGSKKTLGRCYFAKKLITVKLDNEAMATLIHEIIHACQPDLSEDAVLEIEAAIVTGLQAFGKYSLQTAGKGE